ncbi:MAG TPA: aldo/keto reductase [Streptosporangiaceae bacterium]
MAASLPSSSRNAKSAVGTVSSAVRGTAEVPPLQPGVIVNTEVADLGPVVHDHHGTCAASGQWGSVSTWFSRHSRRAVRPRLAGECRPAEGEHRADPASAQGNSRRWIIREVENSLRRLGTDWIDLYQIHRYDPGTDLDETLGALTDLVRAGKVRYIGHSTWPVSAIVAAQWTASDRDRERFASEQPPYSVLTRAIESDVLPTCARYGMGVIPYSPLAGGWLSGRYRTGSAAAGPTSPARQRLANRFDLSLPENQRKLEATEQLADLADKAGLTLIELAIAFVLWHPAVTAAIIGPRTMAHLESQLPAAEVNLPTEVLDRIDDIVPPGVTLNPADNGWVSPALQPAARRR